MGQTIGYKYFCGMHQALCHGPADAVFDIVADDKAVWSGDNDGTEKISIDKPDLFGGKKQEGGIVGEVDILTGEPDQAVNDYLSGVLGSDIPAFRGICTAVLRQVYLGTSKYLKPWKWRVSRIHKTGNGEDQWYDEKAEILTLGGINNAFNEQFEGDLSSYSAFIIPGNPPESGGSLSDFSLVSDDYGQALHVGAGLSDTHPAIRTPLEGAAPLQECHFKVKLVTSGDDDCGVIAFRDAGLSLVFSFNIRRDSDIDIQRRPTVSFINAVGNPGVPIGPSGGVDIGVWYQVDVTYDDGIFDLVMTNQSTMAIHGSVSIEVSGRSNIANVCFENDNFHGAGTSRFDDVQIQTVSANRDMNPVHIVRECLTSKKFGMGYPESDMDDVFFQAAADALFDEAMGISIKWDRESSIEDFIAEILRHIDASLYVHRSTGKFCLKLIRGDYSPEDLQEFDESNVLRIEKFARSTMADLVNEVIVSYWDWESDCERTIPEQNIALIQAMGRVETAAPKYLGFTNDDIANRVALRDLRTLGTPRISGTIYCNRTAFNLYPGDCFKFSWSKYNLSSVIVRVNEVELGGPLENEIKIDFIEDVFPTADISVGAAQSILWESIDQDPEPPAAKTAFELPYMAIVKEVGEDAVNARLTSLPDAGYIGAAAVRPNQVSLNAEIHTDSGSGYTDYGVVDFCPSATLAAAIGYTDESIAIENIVDADLIVPGLFAQIDDELIVVDSVDASDGTAAIRRGILDTVPAPHASGARIYIWDNFTAGDEVEYVATEEIDVKLLTVTGGGILPIGSAAADTVAMASRAIRPYPPGNLKIGGESYPDIVEPGGALTVSWAHRDRIQQTSGTYQDYSYGDIGPETGVTYSVNCFVDDVLDHSESGLSGTSTTWTPTDSGAARVEVYAVRDGYGSWQATTCIFQLIAGENLIRITEDGEIRITESGEERTLETTEPPAEPTGYGSGNIFYPRLSVSGDLIGLVKETDEYGEHLYVCSYDGSTFTQYGNDIGFNCTKMLYGNGKYLAVNLQSWSAWVGVADTYSGEWTTQNLGFFQRSAIFNGSVFVVAGWNGVIYSSSDGSSWTQITNNISSSDIPNIIGLVNDGSYNYALVRSETSGGQVTGYSIWRSSGLEEWTLVYNLPFTSATASAYYDIQYVNGKLFVCGYNPNALGYGRPSVFVSSDNGDNWSDVVPVLPTEGTYWRLAMSIAYIGGLYVILGQNMDAYSSDLSDWTYTLSESVELSHSPVNTGSALYCSFQYSPEPPESLNGYALRKTTDGINWTLVDVEIS